MPPWTDERQPVAISRNRWPPRGLSPWGHDWQPGPQSSPHGDKPPWRRQSFDGTELAVNHRSTGTSPVVSPLQPDCARPYHYAAHCGTMIEPNRLLPSGNWSQAVFRCGSCRCPWPFQVRLDPNRASKLNSADPQGRVVRRQRSGGPPFHELQAQMLLAKSAKSKGTARRSDSAAGKRAAGVMPAGPVPAPGPTRRLARD